MTFLPLEQIDEMESWEGVQLNKAKEILAYELTQLIHGDEEANKARTASHALFTGNGDDTNMPTLEVSEGHLINGAFSILDLIVACGLANTKSEARRLVQQGGIFIDNAKVESIDLKVMARKLKDSIIIRKGKKTYHKVLMK